MVLVKRHKKNIIDHDYSNLLIYLTSVIDRKSLVFISYLVVLDWSLETDEFFVLARYATHINYSETRHVIILIVHSSIFKVYSVRFRK